LGYAKIAGVMSLTRRLLYRPSHARPRFQGTLLLQAVIFDTGGALRDSGPMYLEAINVVLAERGLRLSEAENRNIVGSTADETRAGPRCAFTFVAQWQSRYVATTASPTHCAGVSRLCPD